MKEIIVNVDNYNENSIKTTEGDNLSEVYKIYICKNKRRIDLTNKIAIMAYVNEYGNKKSNILALNITNAAEGEIELPITNVISSENGVYACQIAIYGENNSLEQTAPFSLIVENNIFSKISNTAINSSDFNILSEAIKTTSEYAEKLKEGTENIELQYANKLHEINSQLEYKATTKEVDIERKRIDLLVKVDAEKTEGNSELLDIRIGEDGVSYNAAGDAVRSQFKKVNEKINNVTPQMTTFIQCSKNLFNKDTVIDNKIIYPYKDSNFGKLWDSNDSFASDWIEVEPNTQYIKNFKGCLVTYNSDKEPQEGWDNNGADVGFTFTTRENIKYVRFSILKIHSLSACQFQKGNMITDVETYGEMTLDKNIKIPQQSSENSNVDIYSKYKPLRWLAFGDSHTEQQSYQKWVNEKLNFTYVSNSGLGGSCIAKGYGSVLSFIDRYKRNVTNTEIVTIYGGTNDYIQNVRLENPENKLDNTTFKGAIREIIEWYSTNYPNKFLFFIAPTQCFKPEYASRDYKNNLNLSVIDYVNAMKEVCLEYSIPVIDLYSNIGINKNNYKTLMEDGVHLTKETNKRVSQLIINKFEKVYY